MQFRPRLSLFGGNFFSTVSRGRMRLVLGGLLRAAIGKAYPIALIRFGELKAHIVDLDTSQMVDDFAKRTMATNAIVLGCTAVLVVVSVIAVSQRRRLMELEKEVDRQELLRSGEHVGRIKAEKKLRALVTNRMHSEGGLFFAPIAVVHSCFTECVGTPRQGQFAPSTRALLVFDKSFVSPAAFDGVEEFSHLWVFWSFHLNTNMKDTKVHASGREDSRGHTFPAKVSPPFLKRRVGVFSTRSPHRPNPIGVSLCKVEGVNAAERSIRLSGVDLVDATPVLDIKPYVPEYDCPRPMDGSTAGATEENGSDVRVAEWVGASVRHRCNVEWAPEAEAQLKELCNEHRLCGGKGPRMRFFVGDHDGAMRAITESLSVDVRSLRKTREAASAPHCVLLFDGLRVLFAATVTPLSARFPPNTSSSVKPPPSSLAMGTAVEDTISPKMGAKPGASNSVSSPVIDFDAGSFARGASLNSISTWSIESPSFVETVRVVSVECEEK